MVSGEACPISSRSTSSRSPGERVVPVDRVFFVALTTYLRGERSTDAVADECFVVLRGPIRGQAMTEAGMRKIFRTHRARAGRDTGAAAPVAPPLRDRT